MYKIGQKLYGVRYDDFTVIELTVRDVSHDEFTFDWAASEREESSCYAGRSCAFRFILDSPQKADVKANALMLEALERILRHQREDVQNALQKVDEINERIRKFKELKNL